MPNTEPGEICFMNGGPYGSRAISASLDWKWDRQRLIAALQFALFSWWRGRHTVVNSARPECRRVTQKSHWLSTVSDKLGQAFGQGPEIYHYSPVGSDPKIVMDSSIFTGLPEVSSEELRPVIDDC